VTTERPALRIDVSGIAVEVVRKEIRNLHVGVYPPHGRVRVAAPLRVDDAAVRMAVISRLSWIRSKQDEFMRQDRQSQREFVTGESHYFAGRRYRLDVVEHVSRPAVRLLNNSTMRLFVPPGADRDTRETVLQRWYRAQLRGQLPALCAKWERRVGVTVGDVRIKRMKTLWGSCNAEAKRIWLNLELAKKPTSCLVYVLVHEMIHLLERHHSDQFRALMHQHLPQWSVYRDELNALPLSHEDWGY
jgi:predicted metal-dependent hydrolase